MIEYLLGPENLLAKAQHEYSLITLNKLEQNDYYLVFNVLVSINHLFDWVLNNDNIPIERKERCIKLFNPYENKNEFGNFRKYYQKINEGIEINTNQQIIKALCNNLKHFKKRNKYGDVDENKKYLAVSGNIVCGGANAIAGYYEEYTFIVKSDNGKEIDLIELLRDAINEWEKFLLG
jgi:hypothetical protein